MGRNALRYGSVGRCLSSVCARRRKDSRSHTAVLRVPRFQRLSFRRDGYERAGICMVCLKGRDDQGVENGAELHLKYIAFVEQVKNLAS